jgi:hypothetical protein
LQFRQKRAARIENVQARASYLAADENAPNFQFVELFLDAVQVGFKEKHDKKLADEQEILFPKGCKVWQDTGFQGYGPEGVTTYQPIKKPKGKELTTEQKQKNKELSAERIGVEHSIGGVKVFRIVHDTFRNFREGFDDLVMETACGLHNWRLDFRLTV